MRWSVVTVLLALFILVSGFGSQMVFSAPMPQEDDAVTKLNDENSQLVDESDMDYKGEELKLPQAVGISDSGTTRKYTHDHGTVVYPSLESSFGSHHYVGQHNLLQNLIKGSSSCPLLSDGQQHSTITPSITSSPALMGETSVPVVEFSTADQGELGSTLNDVLSQLQTNIGLVSTGGLIEDLNFVDKDTDLVIVNAPPQVEAVEAEPEVLADPPVVSNLANLFSTSSDSSSFISSASSSSSSSDSISSGGITGGDISSTSIANPFAVLANFALVVAGIFVLSLPIWVPFVFANRRRTHGPLRKKTLALSGTKTKGNSLSKYPLNPNQVKLPYGNYKASPALLQPEYQSTTIEDYYRPSNNPNYSYNMDLDVKPYSALLGNLFPSYSNKFGDPGPLKSKALYGPLSNFFLQTRSRNSYKGKFQKKS